jgi:hypothetical protein
MSTTGWIVLGVVLLVIAIVFVAVRVFRAVLLALRHQRSS